MNILLQFPPMGMGDILSAEPTFEALKGKYGVDSNLYIAGDPFKVHSHCSLVNYNIPLDIKFDKTIAFASLRTNTLEECAALEKLPIVDQYASPAHVVLKRRTPSLYLSKEELTTGGRILTDKVGMGKRIVAISTEDKGDVRRSWAPNNFKVLCDKIRKEYDVVIIDVGTGPFVPRIADHIFSGLTLRETTSVLHHCDILIATNRGIVQLAQMGDLRSIVLYSMVPPERTVHDNKVCYTVHSELDCIFCMWKDMERVVNSGGCYHKGDYTNCMTTISVDSVFDKFKDVF